ncbi:MAG: helix-turn-helix domain-containing protein [Acidimicrobiales bacterium]|nr:helix-turn-helix domain-containing protein [Acidimicrobiales bacterium]
MNADEFVSHLAYAIGKYVRASGRPAQLGELVSFAELCLRIASDGQGGPIPPGGLAGAGVPGDGGRVLMALDIPAVAVALSVGERTARRLVAAGDLPSVVVRGRRLVRLSDLEAFVDGLAPVAGTFRASVSTKDPDIGGGVA